MLGFSLGKLLVLAVLIAAVWYGFKLYERGRSVRRVPAEPPRPIVDLSRNRRTGAWEKRDRESE